jgi:hypothetical protein
MPALKSGVSSLKGDVAALAGRTGLMDEAAAEKYIQEQEAYRQKTFKPTETFGEAPLTKGLELLGGSLPYMAAPIAAGVAAPEGLAALAAAGLTSATQFTGSNLSRQMGEGKKLGETELGSAFAASLPQAALDAVSLKMLPGVRSIFSAVGKEVPEKALLEATKQTTAQVAKDYALATGKAMTAEGLTEAGQQVFERLQAGLSITDEKARSEYFDSFIGGAVLGGTLAPAGRYVERGQEATQREAARAAETKRLADEAEAAKNTPDALMALDAQYTTLKQQMDNITLSVPKKPGKKASAEDKQAYRDAKVASDQALEDFKTNNPDYQSVFAEYEKRKDAIEPLKKVAQQEAMQKQLAEMQNAPGVQQRIPGLEPMETENVAPKPAEDVNAKRSEFLQKQQELAQLMEAHQQKESSALAQGDIAAHEKLRPQRQLLANEQEYINKQLKALGEAPAETSLDSVRTDIEKKKEQLKSMAGEGYDPVKADKLIADIRALEESAKTAQPTQMGLDLGKATKEQVSETRPEFAARLTAAQAERRKALEEEYRQKILPEIQGIQRIASRKGEGPEMGVEIPTRGGEPTPEGSAAMGQMQQTLRGAKPGEQGEFIYTAPEVVTTPPKIQKAPSEGFRLFARQSEPVRPATSEDISQRIASALAQPGLTDEAYAFLRRAENVLPKTNNQGVLSLLDKQLAKIESGAEGRARAGAPKPATLQGFPVGETAVSKRASGITKETLRGPSAEAQPLSLEEEITPLLEARERGGAEAQAGQLGLFPEEEKKLGYIKPDRAAFERFMRSPFVNKLRKALRTDQKAIDRAKLDDLKAKITDLQAKAIEMEKVRLDYSDAARTIQLNRDVGKQRRDINQIRAVMTDRVIDHMELQGRLGELEKMRRDLIDEGRSLGETVELPFMQELNHVEEQLHELNINSAELDGALKTLEGQLKVEAAKITLAKLNPKMVSKEALATAKQNLLDAQRAAGVISSEASKLVAKQTAEAGAARRTADAIAAAKSAQERIDLSKANQERLEAMYGESSRGIEVPAISEAQRASREMGEPVLSQAEQADITKNPLKVLGGYRSSITTIEKRLSQAQRTSNEARMQDLQKLLETRDKLEKQYKAAQFADQRAKILPNLEAAENAYDAAASKIATEPLTWKGMAKDISELSEYYVKAELLEDKINSGKVRLPEEKPPKVIVKPDAKQKKAVAEKLASEQAAEAAKRANAPTTSGEALTRSEAQKAREPEKSTYTGKGIGQEGLSKHDEERLKPLLERKAAGAKLNAAEEAFIKAKTKVQPAGLNVKPEKAKAEAPKERPTVVSLRAVELSEEAKSELKRGSIAGALADVAETSEDALNRVIADRLKMLLSDRTKATLVDGLKTSEGLDAHGGASSNGREIWLDTKTGLNEETLLHESVHAATERIIQMPEDQLTKSQLTAKRELEALYKAVKSDKKITSKNAKYSMSEFVAEALSNKELQDQLRGKKWTIRNAWDSFKKVLMDMLGIKVPENMLDATLASADTLFARPEKAPDLQKAVEPTEIGPYKAANGEMLFRTKQEPGSAIFSRQKGVVDTFLGNILGLPGRVQYIDRFAALSDVLKKGQTAGEISSQEALNAEWLLRFGEQRSMYAGQFLTNGRVALIRTQTPDGVAYTYESKKGVSMLDVANALSKGAFENDTKAEDALTIYEAGARANQVGWEKLNFANAAEAKAEYNALMAQLAKNKVQKDAIEAASKLYRQYNAGLLDFLVETGAITEKKAAELKAISYVPFYRVSGNGEVQLMIDKERPFSIGNIKDEPQLQSLVGGNEHIMPIFTSSVQNTFMLTNMALRNQSVKETSYALLKIGMASRVAPGKGPANTDVVRFKKKGEDYYALINKDMYGISADLVVKGMEGIKTTIPAVFQLMGVPADILRTFVTRNPTYALRQVVRDPLSAWLTTGTDAFPVLSSFKELAKMVAGRSEVEQELMAAGAISSNVFSGDQRDMSKFLKDVSAGKSGWAKAMSRLDALALQGDAATRAVVYKDSLAKGMTKQQALLRTLESMNFSRRGLSPSMQTLSVLIPFFNAQIQGLDVLYRAFKGDMPFSEQLQIRQKLVARGLMLAAGTMAYAMLMQDDEAYKRAKPEERYANWFVYIPGIDEPVRVPIPFELGYLFKALPEAVYNMAAGDEKASKAMGGMYKLLALSNPFALPQAVKPLTEAVLGKSFFSGDIESEREKKTMMPSERYRESTTEVSKLLGQVTGKVGVSPITLDYLMRGYTGPLGIAVVQLANPLLNTEAEAAIAKPSMKASKLPFIGGIFQPVEGRGTLDEAYAEMVEIQQVKGTYNRLVSEGRRAEANAFAQDYATKLSMASTSGFVQKQLGEFAAQERRVIAHPTMSQEEKDKRLEQLDKAKLTYARRFIAAADRTKPQ